jgi:threonine dehydratase
MSPTRELSSDVDFAPDYLSLVVDASLRVYDVCIETPLQFAHGMSERLNSKIYLKREDMQPIHSFKNRGAYNKVCSLSDEERSHGICATSAGNHAQGVALAARQLGIKSRIYCPSFAPAIKIANVRRLGAEVCMVDGDFDDAKRAMKEALDQGWIFIPPFDDPKVIAGAGTVGYEILKQHKGEKPLDAIFVCVGGGGLISGIAAFVKRVRPEIKIIGVNTPDSNAMVAALEKHEPVLIAPFKSTFSDGTAVRIVGKENHRLCELYVDEMITVTNDEICAAIKDMFIETRGIIEPSGALGVAGMKKWIAEKPERQGGLYVAVCSGANINFDRLRFVADRANWGSGAEALLGVVLVDKPGALVQLLFQVRPFEVVGMTYRYNVDKPKAKILINVSLPPGTESSHVTALVDKLKGVNEVETCMDLTNDDLAKEHIRSLIGSARAPEHERLFVIRFIEKPGAMYQFLSYVDTVDFNVSLLHYKASGGDVADMLVGIAVPPTKSDLFEHILNKIRSGVEKGFLADIDEVTDEPSYQAFLR